MQQKDCTTLCVIEYFAKSLEINEDGTICKPAWV